MVGRKRQLKEIKRVKITKISFKVKIAFIKVSLPNESEDICCQNGFE